MKKENVRRWSKNKYMYMWARKYWSTLIIDYAQIPIMWFRYIFFFTVSPSTSPVHHSFYPHLAQQMNLHVFINPILTVKILLVFRFLAIAAFATCWKLWSCHFAGPLSMCYADFTPLRIHCRGTKNQNGQSNTNENISISWQIGNRQSMRSLPECGRNNKKI